MPKTQNKNVWFVGADNGSTGYEVVLEQREVRDSGMVDPMPIYHTLFKIEPGGDAMAIGMMVGYLGIGHHAGAQWLFTERDPRRFIHDAAGPCEPNYHRGPIGKTCRCGEVPVE